MKKVLLLSLSLCALSGCDFIKFNFKNNSDNINTTTNTNDNHTTSGTETTEGNTSEDSGNTETTDNDYHQGDSHTPTNSAYSIGEGYPFKFYDEDGALLADDWNYYIKTTHKIAGELYNGNNGDPTGRGIIFEDKNSYVVSPKFDSWKKVQVDFKIWFSNKTGNKAFHIENEPQFRVSAYTNKGEYLGTDQLLIDGSDVPSNGQCASIGLDLRYPTMSYFIIDYDNTIQKGDAIYAPVFHEVYLKGWDFE